MRAAGAALCLLAVACQEPRPVVLVTVGARPGVREVQDLRVIARQQSDSASRTFPLGERSFPVTFTVTASGRSGDVEIAVEGLDGEGLLRGLGTAGGTLVPGEKLPLDLTLEPADFVVNSDFSGTQRPTFRVSSNGRQAAVMPDDSFLIGFVNDCAMLERCDIFARLFDARGAPLPNDTTMSTEELVADLSQTFSSVPAVAASDRGAFIAWETFDDIRGVALTDGGGHVAEAETVLSGDGAMLPSDPAVAALGGGEFVAVWSETAAGGGKEIRGRLVDESGAPVMNGVTGDTGDFPVSATPDQSFENPSVAASGDGREFAVVWESGAGVMARFFDAGGLPQSAGDLLLTSFEAGSAVVGPRVAYTRDGDAAVSFAAHTAGELAGGAFLFGRFEIPLGRPIGELEALAAPAPDEVAAPALAAGADGGFAVAWHQCGESGDGSGCAVYLQALDPSGAARGPPRVVNTTTEGDQMTPSVAATSYGFVAVWADGSQAPPDTFGGAVRARLIYTE